MGTQIQRGAVHARKDTEPGVSNPELATSPEWPGATRS